MCQSVQPRDRKFIKWYGFSSFLKNISKNIGKNISKNLSGKYSSKLPYHAKTSATSIQIRKAEALGELLIKSRKIIHKKIIQRQLQMKIIKKYQKKDIHLKK